MTPYTGSIFESVQAYNDKVCWIGGYNASESANTIYGVILKTIDGGLNWQKIVLPVPYIIDFDFIDLNNGWLVAADSTPGYTWGLWKTTDGGLTWTLVNRFSTTEPVLIDFVNLNVGWIAFSTYFIHTTDGGNTWIDQEPKDSISGISSMYFLDELHGYAVGYSGKILYTNNGGYRNSMSSENPTPPSNLTIGGFQVGITAFTIFIAIFITTLKSKKLRRNKIIN